MVAQATDSTGNSKRHLLNLNLMGPKMYISLGRGNLLVLRIETRICLNIDIHKIPFDN